MRKGSLTCIAALKFLRKSTNAIWMLWPTPTTVPLWINSSVGFINLRYIETSGYELCVPLLPMIAACCRRSARASSPSMDSATGTCRHCSTARPQLPSKRVAVARPPSVVSCAYSEPITSFARFPPAIAIPLMRQRKCPIAERAGGVPGAHHDCICAGLKGYGRGDRADAAPAELLRIVYVNRPTGDCGGR